MPRFKLTLAYDGTTFVGWQRQASGTSIQGLVENALALLDGAPVAVEGAGRTDAGVHALAQVATADLARAIPPSTLVRALNANLPVEVRVLAAEAAAPTFHARFSATAKTYRYRIWNSEVVLPFDRPYVWHVPAPTLDVHAMAAAAECLEGRHDFSALQGAGSAVRSAERTLFSSTVAMLEPPLITYDVRGDGFLRYMVRTIVGCLVEVGRGRRDVDWMRAVLASKSRARAASTAPPCGLFLVGVEYDGRVERS